MRRTARGWDAPQRRSAVRSAVPSPLPGHTGPPCCSGLGCRLQQLRLRSWDTVMDGLDSTIKDHMRPAALSMTAFEPAAVAWVPQLTQCTITICDTTQLPWLASGLEAPASLVQLSSLSFRDMRGPAARAAAPPALPGLARLPALRILVRVMGCGNMLGHRVAMSRALQWLRRPSPPMLCRHAKAACRRRCGPAPTSRP